MDSAQLGTHSASAFLGGLMAALGFKKYVEKRLDSIEKIVDEKLVFRDKCEQCEKGNDNRFNAIMTAMENADRRAERHEEKLDAILMNLSRRRGDEKGV